MTQAQTGYAKPLPQMEGLTAQFFGWCAKGELRFQRCSGCRAWRHVPRLLCAECGSWEWKWERSSGLGRVFTWTVAMRAIHPGFQADVPYAAVVIEMEEGVRVVSHVTECPPDELSMDMPVAVTFVEATPGVTLPLFRRAHPSREGAQR